MIHRPLDAVVIANRWLPSRTPRAVMNERLFSALPWTGDVYVCDEQKGPPDSRLQQSSLRVHRVPNWVAEQAARVISRLGGAKLMDIPDKDLPWALRSAWRAHNRLRQKQADVLVTVSRSHSGHVAGLAIKRRHRALPWIAVFSDPWLDLEQFGYTSYTDVTRRVNRRLEAATVSEADLLVFTSTETVELLGRRYPELPSRAAVVSQCFDATLFPQTPRGGGGDRLVFRYLGDFYAGRSPRPLLEAVRRLEQAHPGLSSRWRFELVGRLFCNDADACRRIAANGDSVVFLGEVSYLESLRFMATADVLLIIDAPADVSPFLPSKLVEYLGANRPLLGLSPPGASAALVQRLGCPVADVSDNRAIDAALLATVDAWSRDRLSTLLPDATVRHEFDRHVVADRFDALARRLAVREGAP